MKSLLLITLLTATPILASAQTRLAANEDIRFSTQYIPASFQEEERVRRLEKAFPAVEKIYQEYAKENHFPGMVYGVVADGRLIYSGATGVIDLKTKKKATTQSLFRIASMTKSFTAMAILKLQEENKLRISDPAEKYIPEMKNFIYPTRDAPRVTIFNLLTMTAGFPEDNPWGDRQLEDSEEEFGAFLEKGISFSSTPGQKFEYSNLGYAILGNIITRVSAMPYQDYITQNILRPLGMHETRWEYSAVHPDALALGYRWEDEQWKEEPMLHDGAYGAMGGLITSIEDFSKYVAFHLSAYPPRNEPEHEPLKRSAVREMHKPYTPRLYMDAKNADGTLCPVMNGYGFGLGNRQDCKGITRISHSGGLPGFGSEYRFYPDWGVGIICFANRTYAGSPNAQVFDMLLSTSGITTRVLPVSDILNRRKEQLLEFLPQFQEKQGYEIFAENFFLDLSREARRASASKILTQAGKISSVDPMRAENQLRGWFNMAGAHGVVKVFFTLSPEPDPKIQQLDLEFIPKR